MTEKRFLLFAGDSYYPQGGWNDFVASFDTYDEADNYLKVNETFSNRWGGKYHNYISPDGVKYDWYQIHDLGEDS